MLYEFQSDPGMLQDKATRPSAIFVVCTAIITTTIAAAAITITTTTAAAITITATTTTTTNSNNNNNNKKSKSGYFNRYIDGLRARQQRFNSPILKFTE
jgi:hypothetical protein